MFFGVLSLTYHSPITIDQITYGTHISEHGLIRHSLRRIAPGTLIASSRKADHLPYEACAYWQSVAES